MTAIMKATILGHLFAQLFPGASKSLTRCAIGWCSTATKETTDTAQYLTPT
jgi:hypothetical protein